MAGFDEDAIALTAPHQGESDLTEETQDFQFLTNLSL